MRKRVIKTHIPDEVWFEHEDEDLGHKPKYPVALLVWVRADSQAEANNLAIRTIDGMEQMDTGEASHWAGGYVIAPKGDV